MTSFTRFCFIGITSLLLATFAQAQRNPSDYTSLGTLNVTSGTLTINTDTLTMSGAASFTGVAVNQNGGPQIAVFNFDSINIENGATVSVYGSRALSLLSRGDILHSTQLLAYLVQE